MINFEVYSIYIMMYSNEDRSIYMIRKIICYLGLVVYHNIQLLLLMNTLPDQQVIVHFRLFCHDS